jgi:hypothetical protein
LLFSDPQALRSNPQGKEKEHIMRSPIQFKTSIPSLVFTLALFCFGFLPGAQAVVPAPDGGYAGGNTAEGQSALFGRTTGGFNTAVGWFSLKSLTTGSFNTGVGAGTLVLNTGDENTATGVAALLLNTTGSFNTANGALALFNNTAGSGNTATGSGALQNNIADNNTATGINALNSNTTGVFNTAIGGAALINNTTGGGNTATGVLALSSNSTGVTNTAVGFVALQNNIASNNTATGAGALSANTTGADNTAIGHQALSNNTVATNNTAVGAVALLNNIDGQSNTAIGRDALLDNTTGSFNTATGLGALFSNTTGVENTAIGDGALAGNTTGNNNLALGPAAGSGVTTANNVICIGFQVAGANVSDSCFIGNIYSNVQPIVGTNPDSVTISSSGRLGRGNVSSRRYKHDIKPMDKASEVVFALKPVSFRYNKQYDFTQTIAFGLIAEEVAEVNPDLVGRNPEGQPESVRYEQINAMLLNEFLKEHRKVQEQETTIAQLKKEIDSVVAHAKEQDSKIQKVSAQIDMSKAAPQMVVTDR